VRCGCGHRFDGSEERVGDPVLRQKWELPEVVPLVTEHRVHGLVCPACGTAVLAEGDGISGSAFGPRLEAQIAVMAGVYRLSRRQIVELVDEMFGCPVSVGAVNATIMRISAVLADPWVELRDAVCKSEAVHADETSWRLRGESSWLWVAASALVACCRIDPTRSQAAAKELLGEDFGSFIITDRYAGYHWLDVLQQQLCWCHVIRQFTAVSERDGAPGRLGHKLLDRAREVIHAHREYLQDGHDLVWLQASLAPIREQIQALPETGLRGRHLKTRRFCADQDAPPPRRRQLARPMSRRPTRYRLTVHQLRDGASTKVLEVHGNAFITAVATITTDGQDDIVDVHLNDAGPRHLQRFIADAIADQYPPSKRPR